MKANVTTINPAGEITTAVETLPNGCDARDIDQAGSFYFARLLKAWGKIEPADVDSVDAELKNEAAAWSEKNDALIVEAESLGLRGDEIIDYVTIHNEVNAAAPAPGAATEHARPWTEEDIRRYQELQNKVADPGDLIYARARVLAFWIGRQPREEFDELLDEELRMLSAIIGPDCRLLGRYAFELIYPGEKTE